jgi:hypothetical protein
VSQIVVVRAKFGFEVILMALLDEDSPDRKFRQMLLHPQVEEIGITQVTHPQYDYINLITIRKNTHEPITKDIVIESHTFTHND